MQFLRRRKPSYLTFLQLTPLAHQSLLVGALDLRGKGEEIPAGRQGSSLEMGSFGVWGKIKSAGALSK